MNKIIIKAEEKQINFFLEKLKSSGISLDDIEIIVEKNNSTDNNSEAIIPITLPYNPLLIPIIPIKECQKKIENKQFYYNIKKKRNKYNLL